jgi:ArsR family transcriptional regulator
VRSFWSDGVADFAELLILADQAQVVSSVRIDELLAGIADAATRTPLDLRLASESAPDRLVFLQRLAQLHETARLRRDYLKLLGGLWEQLAETWNTSGRPLVEVATERYRNMIAGGSRWVELVIADSPKFAQHMPALLEQTSLIEATVTIAPSFFSGQGLLLEVPHGILVGVPAGGTGPAIRARTDPMARHIKALADPTRLAIACALAERPMTVGEIAKCFDIAQPTVSNHVKILRENDIVMVLRHGRRSDLVVRSDTTHKLFDQLKTLLDPPGSANSTV